MTSTKILRTQAEIVAAFGGPQHFAARFGTHRTASYNYRSGTQIPLPLLCKVVAACADEDFLLAPELTSRLPIDLLDGLSRYHKRVTNV